MLKTFFYSIFSYVTLTTATIPNFQYDVVIETNYSTLTALKNVLRKKYSMGNILMKI